MSKNTWPQVALDFIEWVAKGCLLPPDGGSLLLEDAVMAAQELMEHHETKRQRLIERYLAAIKKHNDGWEPDYSERDMPMCFHVWDLYLQKPKAIMSGQTAYAPPEWAIKVGDANTNIANKVAAEFTDAEMKLILTGRDKQ